MSKQMEKTTANTLGRVNKHEKEINELGGWLAGFERNNIGAYVPYKQTMVAFPNGYGISFIDGEGTYGLEAAVITWKENGKWELCYSTDITDSVIGYMEDEDIVPLCERVASL